MFEGTSISKKPLESVCETFPEAVIFTSATGRFSLSKIIPLTWAFWANET
ncbi:hypothetical protein AB9T88_03690 [Flavobacterium sp. LBUM151]